MVNNKAVVAIYSTTDGVKDLALDVCIASGEADVFIDMDTVADRMPQIKTPESIELQKMIDEARKDGAEYIHLF